MHSPLFVGGGGICQACSHRMKTRSQEACVKFSDIHQVVVLGLLLCSSTCPSIGKYTIAEFPKYNPPPNLRTLSCYHWEYMQDALYQQAHNSTISVFLSVPRVWSLFLTLQCALSRPWVPIYPRLPSIACPAQMPFTFDTHFPAVTWKFPATLFTVSVP